jgi:DNA polymerase-1
MHRAYHAMPPLTTTNGELINAVYGFTSMLLKIFHDLHPEYVACAFDMKAPTFRNLEFVDYKAKRPKMDEELVSQIGRIHEVVKTLNIPIFEVEGFEADDVIATLAEQAKSDEVETIIVTGDRDALQLVDDEHTLVYCPLKGLSNPVLYDEKKVVGKYGLKPAQIAEYKALAGDSSDNYPGVHGIGPKTATELLQKYQTIDNMYQHIDEFENKNLAKLLAENIDFVRKCQKLATAVRDVPITLHLDACNINDYDYEKASRLFAELEFRSLAKKLPGHEEQESTNLRINESTNKKVKKKEKKDNKDQMGLF